MKRRGKWRDRAWLRGAELALTIHASRSEKGSVLAVEMDAAAGRALQGATDEECEAYRLEYVEKRSPDAAAIELAERISRSTYYRVRRRLHEKVAEELRR